ncbi:MAG: prolipoprotein diacylglyceryl transferase family protein [Candidatus Uhrbacteria bacterium]
MSMGITILHLGPIPIHVWGVFVVAGFFAAIALAAHRAPRVGIESARVIDASALAIIASLIGARLGYVFLYDFATYRTDIFAVFRIWEGGLASFGGIIGATLVFLWYIHRHRIPIIRFSDIITGAMPVGWAIGRIGCFVTHMHPGVACQRWFCALFSDGVRRLDLGITEAVLWLCIAIATLALRQQLKAREGLTTAFVIGAYGFGRFFLDFLRVYDARYFGLTPAQYGSAIILVVAFALFVHSRQHRATTTRC